MKKRLADSLDGEFDAEIEYAFRKLQDDTGFGSAELVDPADKVLPPVTELMTRPKLNPASHQPHSVGFFQPAARMVDSQSMPVNSTNELLFNDLHQLEAAVTNDQPGKGLKGLNEVDPFGLEDSHRFSLESAGLDLNTDWLHKESDNNPGLDLFDFDLSFQWPDDNQDQGIKP